MDISPTVDVNEGQGLDVETSSTSSEESVHEGNLESAEEFEDFRENPQLSAFLFREAPPSVPDTTAVAVEPNEEGKLNLYLWFMIDILQTEADSGRPRRKRKATQAVVDMMDNRVCADEGCEEEITEDDLLRCDACKLAVRLMSLLLTTYYWYHSSIT